MKTTISGAASQAGLLVLAAVPLLGLAAEFLGGLA